MNDTLSYRLQYDTNPFKHKFITFLWYLGLPIYILFSLHISLKWNIVFISTIEIVFMYIAISSFWVWPYLIWRYNNSILLEFIGRLYLLPNINEIFREIYCYNKLINKLQPIILIIGVLWILIPYYLSRFYVIKIGFYNAYDFWYILTYAFVLFLAIIGTYGIIAIIRTTGIIVKIYRKYDIQLYPYHYDNLSGLSLYYRFINKTGNLLWGGLMCVPMLIFVAQDLLPIPKEGLIIWGMLIIYIVIILLIYILPNYLIFNKAKSRKVELLNISCSEMVYEINNLDDYNKFMFIRQKFMDLKDCTVTPFNIKNISNYFLGPFYLITIKLIIEYYLTNR
jgi:hypothetical protein